MLTVENVKKSYAKNNTYAVDGVSFTANSGEIFGFLGPNGAGKTTTIKMITQIIKKDCGKIIVDGVDIDVDPIGAKRKIAYVSDNPDVQKKLKGIEYVNFMADMYDISKSKRIELIEKYSNMFGLQDVLNNSISSYSHGMQQKIALIGALVTEPSVLILDEPMVGLDPKSAFNLKTIMKELCAEGRTIFFSTHVLDVAEKFCDKIGIINKGVLIACGSIDEIRNSENMNETKSLEELFLEMTDYE